MLLDCGKPLVRGRLPSTTLSHTVQTFRFETVLALARFPYVLSECAAGGHGCWCSKAACCVNGQRTPP